MIAKIVPPENKKQQEGKMKRIVRRDDGTNITKSAKK